MNIEAVFLDLSATKLDQLAGRIGACLDKLNAEQIWARDSDAANAVGNLVLHLCGNVRQWIGTGIAGLPEIRARDAEFAARSGATPAELHSKIAATVAEASSFLRRLPASRLAEQTRIQGYDVTVLQAIFHVVEHFAGHTGQIIFATKLLTGEDLGFYRHLKQAGHSETTP